MAWRSRGMIWVDTGSTRHAEPLGDQRLDPRIDIGEGADGAGNGTGRDLVARQFEPLPGAVELGIGIGELEAEGGGLGMNAVAAPDGRGVFVLHRPHLEGLEQPLDIADQHVAARISWILRQVSSTSEEVIP